MVVVERLGKAKSTNFRQLTTVLLFQIELDLLRTLPNNRHYDGPNADGIAKLRRVLLAYSVHNPEVEYCQVSYYFSDFCISKIYFQI